MSLRSALASALRKSLRSAHQNLPAILALESAMGLVVALYYNWPPGTRLLARFGAWEQAGGVLAAAIASALAGGLLSEVSSVYLQEKGRWTWSHLENIRFKLALFFTSGWIVYEFYQLQAHWFGDGATWSVLLPKVLVDQLGYTVFFSVPFQTLLTRWHTLRYSGRRLWQELDADFLEQRILPVLLMNWMLWIPGVTFVYCMPQVLQMPLAIFATAIWGLLLPATATQPHQQSTGTVQDLVLPEALPEVTDL